MKSIEPKRHVKPQQPEGEFNGIFILGEAPGEKEEKEGKPFVGMAGNVLNDCLQEAGIDRGRCYISNIYKYRPKNNDFSTIDKGDLARAYAEVQEELAVVRPNVVLALGERALNFICGKKNITKHRGSILWSNFAKCKVIPTFHPAAISREWSYRPISMIDYIKTERNSRFPEITIAPRNLEISRDYTRVVSYLQEIIKSKCVVSFDIEVETAQICAIAFATESHHALCIPFWFGASGSVWPKDQELEIWKLIKKMLEDSSVPKIAQNAAYDMTILRDKYEINVKGLELDTMIAFHAVYPELPKGLDLLCSLYTDVPYYKDQVHTRDAEVFYRYNAMDACVTFECAMKITEEMDEFGIKTFYYDHMHSLIEPLMDITNTGVRINTELRKTAAQETKRNIEWLEELLEKQVGHKLNVNSPKQMMTWLYDEMKLPKKIKYVKGKAERVTADADALEALYHKTGNEALKTVIDIREKKKLLSTYLEVNYDKEEGEERARTSYLITGTETGRLSSRETVYGTGTNLQNIPKGIVRRMFIPDNGKVFINADLSQAEARVVAWLADEARLIRVFESGGDIHRKNAANIFKKREGEVTSRERELAKRIIHASNYGMGPVTFSKTVGISTSDSKKLLNAYFAEYPKIKLWHMNIATQLRRSRTMTTPMGRKRTFFNRWNEALLKEAYAYVPQSTVADLLNMGLGRVYETYRGTNVQILLQIHDAILVQCPKEKVTEVSKKLKALLEIPITVRNKELVIPVDVSVGYNWNDLKKWEQ